jgi:hypothetical protein
LAAPAAEMAKWCSVKATVVTEHMASGGMWWLTGVAVARGWWCRASWCSGGSSQCRVEQLHRCSRSTFPPSSDELLGGASGSGSSLLLPFSFSFPPSRLFWWCGACWVPPRRRQTGWKGLGFGMGWSFILYARPWQGGQCDGNQEAWRVEMLPWLGLGRSEEA